MAVKDAFENKKGDIITFPDQKKKKKKQKKNNVGAYYQQTYLIRNAKGSYSK